MRMVTQLIDTFIKKYPQLATCRQEIEAVHTALVTCFEHGGKLLICGNGGSAADAEHISGEMLKGFLKKRPLDDRMQKTLTGIDAVRGAHLGKFLQGSLPAIPLVSHLSLTTAVANDTDPQLIFAQQIMGLGNKGDVLLGISTSGNAENVCYAAVTAKALGMQVVGFTGSSGGKLNDLGDIMLRMPLENSPHEIQELQLPVYHLLCITVEEHFFKV